MSTQPDYKTWALHYHGLGANVVSVGKDKHPNHPYTSEPTDYKDRRQTFDEVHTLKPGKPTKDGAPGARVDTWAYPDTSGVGIISGVGGWRCVDFDPIKTEGDNDPDDGVPFGVVERFCERLGLDAYAYPWVERSGSGRGWHVWLLCDDELPNTPGVSWGKLEPLAQYADAFHHCELRWSKCFTVVAPSFNGRYAFRNTEQPTTPPERVTVAEVLYAVDGVAVIPVNEPDEIHDPGALSATLQTSVAEQDGPEGSLTDPNTGETWATFDDYKRAEQSAKNEARAVFPMVEYIKRHLGTEWSQVQRDGETRIGKPGAGFGGWHVTADGQRWNNFTDGNGKIGGDCYALVLYCKYGVTTSRNPEHWRAVFEIVSDETGVRFPQYTRLRQGSTVSSSANGNPNASGANDSSTRGSSRSRGRKTPLAAIVLEWLSAFRIRRNMVSQDIEYQRADDNAETWNTLDDDQYSAWLVQFELETGERPTSEHFGRCLSSVAERYDPLHEYFDKLPRWDGVTDHVAELARIANAEDPELFADHLRRWLIGTYATGYYGAITGRTVNEHFLVLHGEQATGKTTFLNKLVPEPLKPYLFNGAVGSDKDSKMLQAESFVVINDELAGLRKREIDELKQILSLTHYRYRPPYGETNKHHKRRVSYCGTTNEDEFLTDPTGARRFLVHTSRGVDFHELKTYDITNVWAQVRALHEQGVPHWFTGDEVKGLNERNKRFTEVPYVESLLLRYFRPGDYVERESRFYTASELAQRIAELYDAEHTTTDNRGMNGDVTVRDGTTRPNPERMVRPLANALRKQGYARTQHRGANATPRYGFWVVEISKDEREQAARQRANETPKMGISVVGSTNAEPTTPTTLPTTPTTPTTKYDDDEPPF